MSIPRPLFEKRCVTSQESSSLLTNKEIQCYLKFSIITKSDSEFFYSHLDGMLVHRRVTTSIKFNGTHLYTWVERGTVKVNCEALLLLIVESQDPETSAH